MLLSKCAVWYSKKTKFIKQQQTSGLLSSLEIKTPLFKIPVLGMSYCFRGINKLIEDIKWMK